MTYEKAKYMLDEVKRIPYPQIDYIERNKNYANILYNDLAGENSELTAITQYLFQNLNMIEYKETTKIMLSIAIEEMHHLEILGQIIKKLGGTPYLMGNDGKYWTSANLRYDTSDIETVMKYNIASERNTIEGYRKAMLYTNNRTIRSIFERIIIDEKTHIRIFENILYDIKQK